MRLRLILCLFWPVALWATVDLPKKTPTEENNSPVLSFPPQVLDGTHNVISNGLVGMANRLDSFFGDKRADDELNRSSLRLGYGQRLRHEHSSVETKEVRFNLRLPSLENRFKLSMRKNEPKADPLQKTLKPAKLPPPVDDPHNEPWRFRADTGVNVGLPGQIFTRGRLRKNWLLGKDIPRFIEELGWYSDRGWRSEMDFNVDRKLNQQMLLRWSNQKDWFITRKSFVTSHGPTVFHNITDDDALSYNARMHTQVNHIWYVDNYGVSVGWRRNLREQWLYSEISPALDFPKIEHFRRVWSILFKMEAFFGGAGAQI